MLNSKYKFEFLWYYRTGSETMALYLNKPVSPAELKAKFPNLKAVRIEFGKTDFKPQKINHDAYLAELVQVLDLEELFIEAGNRLTILPGGLWKPGLKLLSINRQVSDAILTITPASSVALEALDVDAVHCAIDPGLLRLPTLKRLSLQNATHDLSELYQAAYLKELTIQKARVPLDIDFEQFAHLEKIQVREVEFKEPVISLKKLTQLKNLYINGCTCLPVGFDQLVALEYLHLAAIQTPTQAMMSLGFSRFESLKTVSIKTCPIDYTRFLGEMPALKSIDLEAQPAEKPMLDPVIFESELLETVTLKGYHLPERLARNTPIKKLEATKVGFARNESFLSCFTEISIREIDSLPQIDWYKLDTLQSLSCYSVADASVLPTFDHRNQKLESISLMHLKGPCTIPSSWNQCPQLANLSFRGMALTGLPDWERFPSLKQLIVEQCPQFVPSKEIVLWSSLSSIYTDLEGLKDKKEQLNDIGKITSDLQLSKETKLVFGILLTGKVEALHGIPDYKQAFLSGFSTKSQHFRRLAWQHIHLLNPGQKQDFDADDIRGKSVAILGKLNLAKTYYKDKLERAGCVYKNKVDAHTEIVVVGQDFDVPSAFAENPPYFLSEVMLEKTLTDAEPGYLQDLPDDELHNLRKLLWSNTPENERIVVEMVKGGGVSDEIIPDLLVVAKTSKDPNVKSTLRKLLKTKLNPGGLKILSHATNMRTRSIYYLVRDYASFDPEMDVSQMAITYDKRENGNFHAFFSASKSEQNRYRKELFELVYPQFLARPHYVDMRWAFTAAEISFILSHPQLQGQLKRLLLGVCNLNEIEPALLKHAATLENLEWNGLESDLSPVIGEFRKLKSISVHAPHYQTLPLELLQLTKLKEFYVYSNNALQLPAALKPFTEISRFHSSKGYRFME